MSLSNLLQEKENHFIASVQRMNKSGLPLVLYGAGCLGQMTWEFMKRENMPLDLVALNRAYIKPDTKFHDLDIVAIEDLVEGAQDFNCIVALQQIDNELLNYLSGRASEVLIYDPAFIGVNTEIWYNAEFCKENAFLLNELYDSLADDKSRETLVAFLNQRISAKRGNYGSVYEPVHYFPKDIVALQDGETFVDCGAYDGDSIDAFMREVAKQDVAQPESVIGFEPDKGNFTRLLKNTEHLPFSTCVNKGVWDHDSVLYFQSGLALSSRLTEEEVSGESIVLTSIDNLLQGKAATFIKMDVEGAEYNALKGAENTIRNHRPLLAISVYHKPEDLLTIPQLLQSFCPDYHFFLRGHHPELAFELVLYAVPEERNLG